MAQAKRPAHEIRRGPIKATIWENKGKDGVFFKFTVTRLYKDGDDWKSTSSFGSQDIPKLASVLVMVEDWINAQAAQGKAA
jgi:hypothetical protein